MLTEDEALFWTGDAYEEAGRTEYEGEEKINGQQFSLCSENISCSL